MQAAVQASRAGLTDGVVASEAKGVQHHLHALHEVVGTQGRPKVLLHGIGAACTGKGGTGGEGRATGGGGEQRGGQWRCEKYCT